MRIAASAANTYNVVPARVNDVSARCQRYQANPSERSPLRLTLALKIGALARPNRPKSERALPVHVNQGERTMKHLFNAELIR